MHDFYRPIREMRANPNYETNLRDLASVAQRFGYSEDQVVELITGTDDHFAAGDQSLLQYLNQRLEASLDAIEAAASHNEIAIREPVLAGIFPIGSINASARARRAGYILLVNAGLATFAYSFCQLLCGVTDVITPPTPVEIGHKEQVLLMAYWLAAYELYGYCGLAPAVPLFDPARRAVGEILCTQVEAFVLAHEYAHVAADHLKGSYRHTLTEHVPATWARELEADMWAMVLTYIASEKAIRDAEAEANQETVSVLASSVTAAPFVFFELDALLQMIDLRIGNDRQPERSHPPADLRAQLAYRHLEDLQDLDRSSALATSCVSYLRGAGTEAGELAVHLLQGVRST
jgi:hypothetical protein